MDPPIELLRLAGVSGVLVDIDQMSSADWDAVAATLEAGEWIGMGALPTDRTLSPDEVARRVLGPLRNLGVEPPVAARIVITPSCGLASASRDGPSAHFELCARRRRSSPSSLRTS